jgi:hypothetical protein
MSLSALEIVAVVWGIVTVSYLVLFLYRALVGRKEDDTLYLSEAEVRLEEAQHKFMQQITRLDTYAHRLGAVALTMTVVVTGMWVYSVAQNLKLF